MYYYPDLTTCLESSQLHSALLFFFCFLDFTPVCTTEIGRLAMKYDYLQELDCLVATLSVDAVKSHQEWLRDVVAHCENEIEVKFPIIGDADRSISTAFGMLDAGNSDDQDLPLVRAAAAAGVALE
jgi:alkyl hydroperoxide reductase subunit AhpC